MKKSYLFCTSWWFYLTELAPLSILVLSILYNDMTEAPGKLYPLIFVSASCMIFIFLYFFRVIIFSNTELRSFGPFSSRDRVAIEEGQTLLLTLMKRGKLRVELFGVSVAPGFSWMRGNYEESFINLYRDRAIGGKIAIKRVLKYYGISADDIASLLDSESISRKYDAFVVSNETSDGNLIIKIKFIS